jgi:hypothetical protein
MSQAQQVPRRAKISLMAANEVHSDNVPTSLEKHLYVPIWSWCFLGVDLQNSSMNFFIRDIPF